jgi:GT2 family glycosyltransferase
VDYCLRVWKAGFSVAYDSTVSALHDAQEISRRAPWRAVAWSHLRGLAYLFWKHGYMWSCRRLYRRMGR